MRGKNLVDPGIRPAGDNRDSLDRGGLFGQRRERPLQMEVGGSSVGASDENGMNTGGHFVASLDSQAP